MQNSNKKFIYFSKFTTTNHNNENDNNQQQQQQNSLVNNNHDFRNGNDLLKRFFPDILKALGDRAIRENNLSLRELEQHLQNHIHDIMAKRNSDEFSQNMLNKNRNSSGISNNNDNTTGSAHNNRFYQHSQLHQQQQENFRLNYNFKNNSIESSMDLPIVGRLIERGYLVDSKKNWLKKKGFLKVGQEILYEIIK